jgi:hypothetical protein
MEDNVDIARCVVRTFRSWKRNVEKIKLKNLKETLNTYRGHKCI